VRIGDIIKFPEWLGFEIFIVKILGLDYMILSKLNNKKVELSLRYGDSSEECINISQLNREKVEMWKNIQ
jgi:hypothetical protein